MHATAFAFQQDTSHPRETAGDAFLDPGLPEQLTAAHAELHATVGQLACAVEQRAGPAAADAARRCREQMQALHRLEALRLYPAISRLFRADPESMGAFTRVRLDVTALGRRFLRVIETALDTGAEGAIGAADVRLATVLLERYASEKRQWVYPLYAAAAASRS